MGSVNHSIHTSDLMMAHSRRQDTFDDSDYVSCPVGGEWWKCEDVNYPTFIGCCSSNPCSGAMCPEEDLFPMGFGPITTPTPDYPNHSCPYGGLWYTCADNSVAFQGCCNSNPCNGVGCPASDLRPAGVHTVVTPDGTFTVAASVATTNPTGSTSSPDSTSSPLRSDSKSINTAAIAGGAAAAAVVVTVIVALVACWLIRRRRMREAKQTSLQQGLVLQEPKPFYKDPFGAVMTPLPRYSRRTPSFQYSNGPYSPAPTYRSSQTNHPPHTEPQEVMGLGLSEDEFNRRTKSRSPANHFQDGPVELATQRFSSTGNCADAEARSPLLEDSLKQKPKSNTKTKRHQKRERQSRLRSRPAVIDLRAEVSRSSSRGPAPFPEPNG